MNVKQLIKKLQEHDQELEITIQSDQGDGFIKINFIEEITVVPCSTLSTDYCLKSYPYTQNPKNVLVLL